MPGGREHEKRPAAGREKLGDVRKSSFCKYTCKIGQYPKTGTAWKVQPGIKSKTHPTSHAVGQKQIVHVLRYNDPGTPANAYYAWLSTVFA